MRKPTPSRSSAGDDQGAGATLRATPPPQPREVMPTKKSKPGKHPVLGLKCLDRSMEEISQQFGRTTLVKPGLSKELRGHGPAFTSMT